ncbi:MAG: N-6 DNA methylase [bacterium]|nr:N-6 DNA methylase [bacterium]
MHPVETYLKSLNQIYSTGGATAETSFYSPLENLLNAIGGKLKPRVQCVTTLKDTGAGLPDMGLFTGDQIQKKIDKWEPGNVPPERGVVEIKGWDDNTVATAQSKQVTKYWKKYNLVLVTNYREFILIGRDINGNPEQVEFFSLAASAEEFLTRISHARKTTAEFGERFEEFLRRVLLHAASLTNPEDLAWYLASYAREARFRIDEAAELKALASLKEALEQALGMKFEGDQGEHFFRATLVQTLFYGVFSSWVLWSRQHPSQGEKFDWHAAAWTLHVPMVKNLFEQIAQKSKLKPLRLDEMMDWTGRVLNRVDRSAFFEKFEEEHAVQYFYEPFLKAYDPQLRKDLGVWYTPPEIVQYQVERVDQALRSELDIPDGLADQRVVILDPCCGTGAYLVETLKRIHKTLDEKGSGAMTAQELKKAALERVFGFEILPAPFVVSHLQIGLMLRLLGAPIDNDSDERAGVYLTNALTGWEPSKDPKKNLPIFPELMQERDAANKVKQEEPILVIIGNPPYNAFAGTSPSEEGGLVNAYKEGLTKSVKEGGWGIKKFNLDDLYVRFFRIAERRIMKTGKGVVSYISNFSYLGDPSFVAMRNAFLQSYDKIWIDCMNGDSRETGKQTPDGKPDPSVFSTTQSSVGIRVGTAISVMIKNDTDKSPKHILFKHHWGVKKRQQLLDSLKKKRFNAQYQQAYPEKSNKYSFKPLNVSADYLSWPKITALSEEAPVCGYKENRGFAMIQDNKQELAELMKSYYDKDVSWESLARKRTGLTRDAARFPSKEARAKVIAVELFHAQQLLRYQLRPLDTKWCYYSQVRPLWNEPRPALFKNHFSGNAFLVCRPAGVASPEGIPFYFTSLLGDFDFIRGHSYHFPVRVRQTAGTPKKTNGTAEMFGEEKPPEKITANLSTTARAYLKQLKCKEPDSDTETAGLIWMHALAIGYSPLYLSENADGVRQDWPRIPLPSRKAQLLKSAALGRQVAALLNTEKPVSDVSSGKIQAEFKLIGIPTRTDGKQLKPDKGDFDLTAGWGHGGKNNVCMPGKGKIVEKQITDEKLIAKLGETWLDIYLNDNVFWADIPKSVWDYHIGGYQVIKKWLSYREKSMLGRGMNMDEIKYVMEMSRRIAAIILMQSNLDQNYSLVVKSTWSWPD